MADETQAPENTDETTEDSLESPSPAAETNDSNHADTSLELEEEPKEQQTASPQSGDPNKKSSRFKKIRQSLNIYLVLFCAVILMAIVIILIAFEQSRHSASPSSLKTQTLSQATLNQLAIAIQPSAVVNTFSTLSQVPSLLGRL